MREALEVLVERGADGKGLSAPVISRLKRRWNSEYEAWRERRRERDGWSTCGQAVFTAARVPRSKRVVLVVV